MHSGIRWTSVGSRDGPTSRGGVIRHTGPAHPKYSTCEARLRSFRDWPPALRQRPQQLAEAGFFYMGLSDQVKCFSCDGGLRNWQSEDEPWTEHARWFSRCNFVRLVKGDEFVAKSLSERPPENNLPPFPEDEITPSNRPADEEARLRQLMASPAAVEAMAQGLDASRVKVALRDRLRAGLPNFSSSRQLIDAVFGVHREQEDRVGVENEPSPAAFARRRGSSTSTPSLVETNASESGTGPQSMDFEVGRQESHGSTEGSSSPNVSLCTVNDCFK